MKATKQYFPVALFIVLYKVVLLLSLWMKSQSVTIPMFILLYKVVLKFELVDEILKCDHSNKSY